MTELIFEVVEDPEAGFRAEALGYPIFTHAEDLTELRRCVQEAVDCYFTGPEVPRPDIALLRLAATIPSL